MHVEMKVLANHDGFGLIWRSTDIKCQTRKSPGAATAAG